MIVPRAELFSLSTVRCSPTHPAALLMRWPAGMRGLVNLDATGTTDRLVIDREKDQIK